MDKASTLRVAKTYLQNRIQETNFSCGAAVVASILNTEGVSVSEKEVRKALGTNKDDGTQLPNIRDFFKGLGCKTEMASYELSDLEEAVGDGRYVIVSMQMWDDQDRDWENTWTEGHYCVLSDITSTQVILHDPSRRRRVKIPREVFMTLWHDEETSGKRFIQYAIQITPNKSLRKRGVDFFERQNPRDKDLP